MTKLSTAVNSKLSSIVIEQLQHKHICTLIQFIDEDSEKLASFTGFSLKVYIHTPYIYIYIGLLRRNKNEDFKIKYVM